MKSEEKSGVTSPFPQTLLNQRGPAWSASNIHKYTGKAWGNHRPSASISRTITLHSVARVARAERRRLVKRAWYREPDYTFGQLMLTLRTRIGLTQAGLAKLLGISRHAVAEWEAGRSYPTAEHLQTCIALDVPTFYDREQELATLEQWIVEERCRVVSVLGMGGIGKSALAVRVMHRVAAHFEVVLWRSLRDAPSCSALLEACLQVLAPQPLPDLPDALEGRLHLLMEQLRARRALLVLDNLEMLLEEGEGMGHMRAGSEGYAQLLRQMAQTVHQSCLLLTSREKPSDLVPLEGSRTPVGALRPSGLGREASEQLLEERELVGTASGREQLIERYGGNPLALKIVARTIVELFGGEIAPFLEQGEVVFGSIRELLGEQFARLSPVGQTVLLWLAILREPVSIDGLLSVLGMPLPRAQVLEAVEALRRRSLVELGQRRGSFTLQAAGRGKGS